MSLAKPLLPQGAELAAPVSRSRILLSLVLAFALSLLPWADEVRWLLPDVTLMVLLYWCIHTPRQIGLGTAFGFGVLADVAHGVLLGLDALAYCSAAYVVLLLHRRLQGFALPAQTLQLAPLLFLKEGLVLTLGLAIGRGEVDWRYLAAGLSAALLWLPLAKLMNRLFERPDPLDRVGPPQ